MARHAIAADDKRARRDTILAAARALFNAGEGSLPSAAEIAAAAGLAKGTVYLYFRTKEEIFVALLLESLDTLLDGISAVFRETGGRRADKVAAFLAMYVEHLHAHPELLHLDALAYGVLEANLGPDKLRAFKLDFVALLTRTADAVEGALRLAPGRGIPLLLRSFALTRGLWQAARPYEGPTAIEAEPAFGSLRPDFRADLTEALAEYWRGALTA